MPRRHVFRHVVHAAGSRPSGRLLDRALIQRGYTGPLINWGRAGRVGVQSERGLINATSAVALASNKRIALNTMRAAGVPCPAPRDPLGWSAAYPIVARTDRHHAGSGFWLVTSQESLAAAMQGGATHFMEYIEGAREFRVHIVNGESIKLTEKLWENTRASQVFEAGVTDVLRSHANGWRHMVPRPDAHRVTLRRVAKQAVAALGLDFGAVDVLMREGELGPECFVLEVNTAPGFQAELDTCDRYADAFVRMTR